MPSRYTVIRSAALTQTTDQGVYSQNIGSLAGYPFAPYLADGLGRRGSVFFGACIMCVAVAIQTAAQSFGMFIGARQVLPDQNVVREIA